MIEFLKIVRVLQRSKELDKRLWRAYPAKMLSLFGLFSIFIACLLFRFHSGVLLTSGSMFYAIMAALCWHYADLLQARYTFYTLASMVDGEVVSIRVRKGTLNRPRDIYTYEVLYINNQLSVKGKFSVLRDPFLAAKRLQVGDKIPILYLKDKSEKIMRFNSYFNNKYNLRIDKHRAAQ